MYLGGVVPLDHGEMHQAFQAASRAAEVLGLKRGYVGVDFILAREGPVIVDINPRLTTSYVGLRQTASINVAEWMVNACLTGGLPASLVHSGYAIFLKTHVGCERGYVMVEGYGNTLAKAAGALRGALSALSLPGDRN
jgi:predicted ATP-grasp superfamily ATP-dependent carboligase